jgi:hypothetical protein
MTDAPGGAQEGDAKAAHTRRREQVRRAQRYVLSYRPSPRPS